MVVLHLHGCAKINPVVDASTNLRNHRQCVMLPRSPADHADLLHENLHGSASSDQEDDSNGPRKPQEIPSFQRTQSRKNSWCRDWRFYHLLGPVFCPESHLRPMQKLLTPPRRVSSCCKMAALRQQRAQPNHLRLHEQGLQVSLQETSRVFVLFHSGSSTTRHDLGKVVL